MDSTQEQRRRQRWENATISLLFVGYMGYYLCRSNFSVCRPLIIDEYSPEGVDKAAVGFIVSVGTFLYAMGKFTTGVLVDFVGGRRMFLVGMIGSVACTLWFGASAGFVAFLLAWSANRLVQSMGWGALVKIAASWLSFERYGRVMGFLTLSYLFGDAIARYYLGWLISLGLGWRGVYGASAATLAVIATAVFFALPSSPKDLGMSEPPPNPGNLFGELGGEERPRNLVELLSPFLTSFSFWMVLLMSLGLTFIRETFNDWLPTYLHEAAGLSPEQAGKWSAVFPLAGGVSALITGYLADRGAGDKRGLVMVGCLIGLVGSMFFLIWQPENASLALCLSAIAAVGLCMIGPYTFLSGAIALDMGGRRASSTAAGLADGVGYLGAMASGYGIGKLAQERGWSVAFGSLAFASAVTAAAGFFYWLANRRPATSAR